MIRHQAQGGFFLSACARIAQAPKQITYFPDAIFRQGTEVNFFNGGFLLYFLKLQNLYTKA
jgi:hypothetical protein